MTKTATWGLLALAAAGGIAGAVLLAPRPLALRSAPDQVRDLIDTIESGAQPSGWIVRESVPLQREPTAGAAALATLRRGTALVVAAEAGGWAHVKLYHGDLQGWVPSAAIGSAQDAVERPEPARARP